MTCELATPVYAAMAGVRNGHYSRRERQGLDRYVRFLERRAEQLRRTDAERIVDAARAMRLPWIMRWVRSGPCGNRQAADCSRQSYQVDDQRRAPSSIAAADGCPQQRFPHCDRLFMRVAVGQSAAPLEPKNGDMTTSIEDRRPEAARGRIHPWSAVVLVVVDSLWTLAEWVVLLWAVTIPLSFLAVAIPTYLIQRFWSGDAPGRALAVSSLLGVLAAVPTPITGTAAGALFLGLAGVRSLKGRIFGLA